MIPTEIFNGEEWEMELPDEAVEISHELSAEEGLLSFETPRLALSSQPANPPMYDDEYLWFFVVQNLRNALSLLDGSGMNAHEERTLDHSERRFYLGSVLEIGKV